MNNVRAATYDLVWTSVVDDDDGDGAFDIYYHDNRGGFEAPGSALISRLFSCDNNDYHLQPNGG